MSRWLDSLGWLPFSGRHWCQDCPIPERHRRMSLLIDGELLVALAALLCGSLLLGFVF